MQHPDQKKIFAFFAAFNCLDFYIRWIQHVLVFLHFSCCYVALYIAV